MFDIPTQSVHVTRRWHITKVENKSSLVFFWGIIYAKQYEYFYFSVGPGWLNELGSWITKQLIQAYHQYGVGSRPAL